MPEVLSFLKDLSDQAATPTVVWEEFIKDPDPLPKEVVLDEEGNPVSQPLSRQLFETR